MDHNKEHLIGKNVIITKSDYSEVAGKVIRTSKQDISLLN